MRKLLLIILFLVLPLLALAEVKTIEIKHRAAVDIEPLVRQLLDEGEKVQAAGAHLLLVADGESLEAAEQLIKLLDQPQRNLLIRVRHSEETQQVGKDGRAKIYYGTQTGLSTSSSAAYQLSTSAKNQEQTLRLVEGGRGMIKVGQDIPYTEQWAAVAGRYLGHSERTSYKTISTGFWVYPLKVIGDKVLVDIEPYIENAGKASPQAAPQIDYSQLRSRLQVPIGQWYPLGGQLSQRDQVSQAIVSWRASNSQVDRQLQIRIEPVE